MATNGSPKTTSEKEFSAILADRNNTSNYARIGAAITFIIAAMLFSSDNKDLNDLAILVYTFVMLQAGFSAGLDQSVKEDTHFKNKHLKSQPKTETEEKTHAN